MVLLINTPLLGKTYHLLLTIRLLGLTTMVEEAIFTDVQVFEAPLITDDTEARPGEEHHQGIGAVAVAFHLAVPVIVTKEEVVDTRRALYTTSHHIC